MVFGEAGGKLSQELWMLEVKNSNYPRNVLWDYGAAEQGLSGFLSQSPSLLLPALAVTLTPAHGGAGCCGLPPCLGPARIPVSLGPKSQPICVELCTRGISLPSSIREECSDGKRQVQGQAVETALG